MGVIGNFFANVRFDTFIQSMYFGGWYQFVFPFMLTYAVVFTILNKVKLFEEKKPIKVIIALIFSFFAIAFPITGDAASCGLKSSPNIAGGSCQTLGDLMMIMFPGVTAFAIGVLALYIVAAMLGVDLMDLFGNKKGEKPIIKWILGGLGIAVVAYYYARGFGWYGFSGGGPGGIIGGILTDPVLYILIIFVVFFIWVTKDDRSAEDRLADATRGLDPNDSDDKKEIERLRKKIVGN